MGYLPLPQATVTAAPDSTGRNTGNLTSQFDQVVLNSHVAWYECYHMVVTSVPAGAQATIWIGSKQWGFTFPFSGSEWDPSQPMLLQDGQEVFFFWSVAAATVPAPVVTMWLRYDPALPGNPAPSVRGGRI